MPGPSLHLLASPARTLDGEQHTSKLREPGMASSRKPQHLPGRMFGRPRTVASPCRRPSISWLRWTHNRPPSPCHPHPPQDICQNNKVAVESRSGPFKQLCKSANVNTHKLRVPTAPIDTMPLSLPPSGQGMKLLTWQFWRHRRTSRGPCPSRPCPR